LNENHCFSTSDIFNINPDSVNPLDLATRSYFS
jgi:hypothetical protein